VGGLEYKSKDKSGNCATFYYRLFKANCNRIKSNVSKISGYFNEQKGFQESDLLQKENGLNSNKAKNEKSILSLIDSLSFRCL